MALSCVTSPASLGLLRPICACTHVHTHAHTHTGGQEPENAKAQSIENMPGSQEIEK